MVYAVPLALTDSAGRDARSLQPPKIREAVTDQCLASANDPALVDGAELGGDVVLVQGPSNLVQTRIDGAVGIHHRVDADLATGHPDELAHRGEVFAVAEAIVDKQQVGAQRQREMPVRKRVDDQDLAEAPCQDGSPGYPAAPFS